jgi:hypothetical protein
MESSSRRAVERPGSPDRRRATWREFRHAYPGVIATSLVALLVLLVVDGMLLARRARYEREFTRLRAGLTDVQRQKADAALASDEDRLRMIVALGRRQAAGDATLHLSVALDSAQMRLEREGATLRAMPVEVGSERVVGEASDTLRMVVPRGKRTVVRVLTDNASWEVPSWAYTDRGLAVPAERTLKGALGPVGLVLNGGTVVYSMPSVGPLNDSAYVLPGSLRARADDLNAILPNLQPGMSIYFY